MTKQEWALKSPEWRNGWRAAENGELYDPDKPEEWKIGYQYAVLHCEHGAGPMENITPIEANLPHKVSEVICVACCYRWVAVRPENTLLKDLECPGCKQSGAVIETGEVIDDTE